MAPVKVSTDVKIVAIVLGISVLLAVVTIVIVAFFWRPKMKQMRRTRTRSAENGGEEISEGSGDDDGIGPRPGSLAVESRELEDRAINRDGSNLAPTNMVPKYE